MQNREVVPRETSSFGDCLLSTFERGWDDPGTPSARSSTLKLTVRRMYVHSRGFHKIAENAPSTSGSSRSWQM